jgi:hypothetical protein
MQTTLIAIVALHILAGVFWAGSTFTLARTGGALAERLFRPQMGAAAAAIATGTALWFFLHRGGFGLSEEILALGALCALAAAGVQGVSLGPAARQLAHAGGSVSTAPQDRIATGQRVAAGLLAITIICMAMARYV